MMRIKEMTNEDLFKFYSFLASQYSEPYPKTIQEKIDRYEKEILKRMSAYQVAK